MGNSYLEGTSKGIGEFDKRLLKMDNHIALFWVVSFKYLKNLPLGTFEEGRQDALNPWTEQIKTLSEAADSAWASISTFAYDFGKSRFLTACTTAGS